MEYRDLWQRLLPIYDEGEAKAIVRLVLEERFGLSLADVLAGVLSWDDERGGDGEKAFRPSKRQELERLMRRLEKGEPVQYVLGEAWFRDRRFHVEKGVLIPRQETEELVEWVVGSWKEEVGRRKLDEGRRTDEGGRARMLDIGTGSGCIAVSLALELRDAAIAAWDISDEALRIARGNAEMLGAAVTFQKQDALVPPTGDVGLWDVIVSNPPYVCRREAEAMERNVLEHEPHEALFVPDDDALLFYRAIARYGCKALRPGGALFFEINPLYADELAALFRDMGYSDVEERADQFGKRRFFRCRRRQHGRGRQRAGID